MIVIPSLEILGGRVVAPDDGDLVLSEDPVAAATAMRDDGALFFQLVDLDAIRGTGDNLGVVETFVAAGLACQVAGGVRSLERAERLVELGADRIVVGSMLHASPDDASAVAERFGPRAVAAIDVEAGQAVPRGAPEAARTTVAEAVAEAVAKGFARVLITAFDGGTPKKNGADADALGEALDAGELEVFANVCASERGDLDGLKPLKERGLSGVVLATACRTLDAVMR